MLGVAGRAFAALLAWTAQRARLQESIVIQENVVGFPTSLLLTLLGFLYFVDVSEMDPADYGWPVSRRRKWTVLRHRGKTRGATTPWSIFARLFRADPLFGLQHNLAQGKPAWDVFFSGTTENQFLELQWASQRPSSCAYESGCGFNTLEEFEAASQEAIQEAFWRSLTECEQDFLQQYRQTAPDGAYSLNQNPSVSFTASKPSALQTLIRNMGILWWLVTHCQGTLRKMLRAFRVSVGF